MRFRGTDGPLATLQDVLTRREERAQTQQRLLEDAPCVISFSMNIPGARKAFPLAAAGFEAGLREIAAALPEGALLRCVRSGGITGEEAVLAVNCDPRQVKACTVKLEETHPLGRLWDIDVLGQDGLPLSRSGFGYPRRTCLLCGQDAKICGRSQAHSREELFARTADILNGHFRTVCARQAAECVCRAMEEEVSATPKPGLVDRNNTGSHRDMDHGTFLTSIAALRPFFAEFFLLGWDHWDLADEALFALLREKGVGAEQAMFAATGGINTHKGMIFSAAILCGALGRLHGGVLPVTLSQLREGCAALGRQALSDFEAASLPTAGMRCYLDQKVLGIRGEAAAGFPAAAQVALPALRRWKAQGVCMNDRALYALLHLIAHVEDTNMIHRGGAAEAARRREEAQALLPSLTPDTIVPELHRLDGDYIARNLSPGGCADLLSLALALEFLAECGLILPDPEAGTPLSHIH